jgi:hypothetical protein
VNQVTKTQTGAVAKSKLWDQVPVQNDDLMTGVALSFPILGIGTNQWVVRHKGEDRLVTIPGTEYAAPFVDVVLVKAQKEMSRVFYASGYVQGVRGRKPDCWSSNGVKPDETVPVPVNPICATCPNAQWGSGGSAAAPKAQACQQRRRTVVVPYAPGIDLTNEAEGGPMLFSLPPGSLTNLVRYGEELNSLGLPYAAVVTRLSYEPLLKYSKVQFNYQKSLDDAESEVIISMLDSEVVKRILNSKINVDGPEVDAPHEAAPAPKAAIPSAPTPAPTPPKAAIPEQPKAPAKPSVPAPKPGGFAVVKGITEAVAKPAAPPPSSRPVVTAAPEPEEDDTEGAVPDDMTTMFDKIINEQ